MNNSDVLFFEKKIKNLEFHIEMINDSINKMNMKTHDELKKEKESERNEHRCIKKYSKIHR